jgi:hypothetical protein
LKEVIADLLAAQTPEQNLRRLENLAKGREIVAGGFRRPEEPKNTPEEASKNSKKSS